MNKHYFSWEEEEAYKEGKDDVKRNKRDYDHDKYATEGVDCAYWNGRKEQERQEEFQQLEEQERREMEEREENRMEKHRREQQRQEEEIDQYNYK